MLPVDTPWPPGPAAAARMTAETLPGWFARRCVVDQTGPVLQAGFPARITALCPNSAGRRRSELGLTVVLAKKVRRSSSVMTYANSPLRCASSDIPATGA